MSFRVDSELSDIEVKLGMHRGCVLSTFHSTEVDIVTEYIRGWAR